MNNSNEMSNVIFNYTSLLNSIKSLKSELKMKTSTKVAFGFSCVFLLLSFLLVLFKSFIPIAENNIGWIALLSAFIGIVIMTILIYSTSKNYKKKEVIEENANLIFQRRKRIESILYSYFDSPYKYDKEQLSEIELAEKRKSFRSTAYAYKVVDYLIGKFEKEVESLFDRINKGLDAAYVTGFITVAIDVVNSIFKASTFEDSGMNTVVQRQELFSSVASCILVLILYSFAVWMVKQAESTMFIDYKTNIRNFEYTIDVLKEIKRELHTQQTTERNDVGYLNEKALPEMLICETLSSNDNSEEDNGYEKTIKAKYYVHESNKAKGTIDEVKFKYEKHQTKGEVETDSKKADEGATSHLDDNEQAGCVIANGGASELTDDGTEKTGSDENADEPKAIIGSNKDINIKNDIDEKDKVSVDDSEETAYKDLGNGQADTQVDDQDGRNDEDDDDDDDHDDDQSNK